MHKRFVFIGLILLISGVFSFESARAISNNVVISVVQIGNLESSSNESVEIFNNSTETVEITNWCLYYASEQNELVGSKMGCFIPESISNHIYLPARTSALFISDYLKLHNFNINYDGKFYETLSNKSGHIRLLNSEKLEIDKVAWGAAVSPELRSTDVPIDDLILKRKLSSNGIYVDSDDNYSDFEIVAPSEKFESGNIFEVEDSCSNLDGVQIGVPDGMVADNYKNCTEIPVDLCSNIENIQSIIPVGFALDEYNECVVDVCSNIEGVQSITPDGYVQIDYICNFADKCININDIQAVVPPGYFQNEFDECFLNTDKLLVSELLPNSEGVDAGNEYIEIYNPNDFEVDLSIYRLQIMPSGEVFNFPTNSVIRPLEYRTFYNTEIKFTLLNTSGGAKIISSDNQSIDSSSEYNNPDEGMSWGLIENIWQYSNQLTPNSENQVSFINKTVELISCGPNQYRNETTGRCRNIISTSITPCRDGQYRSEITGRCRNIANDVSSQLPCGEGEERNPDTNRCRKTAGVVLGSSDLKPCAANQYRNPETNRCRNIVSLAKADYEPENGSVNNSNDIISLSYLAVFIMAVGYGIWEWRNDIVKFTKKFRKLVHFG